CARPSVVPASSALSERDAMREDGKLDYLELPATDLAAHKAFYAQAFGWRYQDYGPDYAAFNEGLDGGFTPDAMTPKPLPILYAHDLEAMQAKVEAAGGPTAHPIFAFPGGRRCHSPAPSGKELPVWSQTETPG